MKLNHKRNMNFIHLYNKFRKFRGNLIDNLPFPLKRFLIYNFRIKVPKIRKLQKARQKTIKKKGKANILFIVSSLAMWKYEDLLYYLIEDKRFKINILIYPFPGVVDKTQIQEQKNIQNYLKKFPNISIYNKFDKNFNLELTFKAIDPDILFYTQPYDNVYNNFIDYNHQLDKLICYTPYGIGTVNGGMFFNSNFTNYAWKIFSATKIHYEISKKSAYNKGENIVVVGRDKASKFRMKEVESKWENPSKTIKIIWAPHFSISEGLTFNHSSFLDLNEFMLELPEYYNGKIEIIFKPHPSLRTLLYQHKDWGKEKTDKYYQRWSDGCLTNIEEGDYSTLFAYSDSMIHDSISFMGEYLYTEKPVLYYTRDEAKLWSECNDFGKECIKRHYISKSKEDIKNYIDKVLIRGNDDLKGERIKFYKKILEIDKKRNSGELIYNHLISELFKSKIN